MRGVKLQDAPVDIQPLGEKIGSTTLVDMIRCLKRAWVRLGSSHTSLCTKLSKARLQMTKPEVIGVYPLEAADLLVRLAMVPNPKPTWWNKSLVACSPIEKKNR